MYNRNSFNEWGDVIAHYGKPKEKFEKTVDIPNDFNKETINTIILFKEEIEKNNGKLLFSYPCLEQASFNSIKPQIAIIDNAIKENGIKTLGTPEKYSFSENLYYNTYYHLIKNGVDLRTNLLISDLKKSMAK